MKSFFLKAYITSRKLKYSLLSDAKIVVGRPIHLQPILLKGCGSINFGNQVVLGVLTSPLFYSTYTYMEARSRDSAIVIGDNVWCNNGLTIIALNSSIRIYNNVNIGWNVSILSSDFHGLDASQRRLSSGEYGDIEIHENVWICSNVMVLKGVTIGRNSVIAAGSIVSEDIPPNVLAGGIPAKIIRHLP